MIFLCLTKGFYRVILLRKYWYTVFVVSNLISNVVLIDHTVDGSIGFVVGKVLFTFDSDHKDFLLFFLCFFYLDLLLFCLLCLLDLFFCLLDLLLDLDLDLLLDLLLCLLDLDLFFCLLDLDLFFCLLDLLLCLLDLDLLLCLLDLDLDLLLCLLNLDLDLGFFYLNFEVFLFGLSDDSDHLTCIQFNKNLFRECLQYIIINQWRRSWCWTIILSQIN